MNKVNKFKDNKVKHNFIYDIKILLKWFRIYLPKLNSGNFQFIVLGDKTSSARKK